MKGMSGMWIVSTYLLIMRCCYGNQISEIIVLSNNDWLNERQWSKWLSFSVRKLSIDRKWVFNQNWVLLSENWIIDQHLEIDWNWVLLQMEKMI